jgi:uncharacterized glyoxalase superfamily protein PhnB
VLSFPPYLAGLAAVTEPETLPAFFSQSRPMEEMRSTPGVCSISSKGTVMKFTDVTPNLIVADIDRSLTFYRDVLGFSVVTTVPDAAPFVFVWLQRDTVKVFLNTAASVQDGMPDLAARPIGGTNTLFMVIEAGSPAEGIDALYGAVKAKARVVMPIKDQFYGMREFGIEDPDGYVIFIAQRI